MGSHKKQEWMWYEQDLLANSQILVNPIIMIKLALGSLEYLEDRRFYEHYLMNLALET